MHMVMCFNCMLMYRSAAAIYYLKQTGLFLTCPSVDDRGYFSSKATRGYVSLGTICLYIVSFTVCRSLMSVLLL